MNSDTKIIAIVGPTASGKTALGIDLALQEGGEIINADSRQIYAGFPATTAKPSPEELATVPHHLIGTHPIGRSISVVEYKKLAEGKIAEIIGRGRIPILVGGTGHWIDAVLYDQRFPEVAPDDSLREKLSHHSNEELFEELSTKDPLRAQSLGPDNKKRLIRALEIVYTLGAVPLSSEQSLAYDATIIGIKWPLTVLRERIESRTDLLLPQMLEEANAGLTTLTDARAQELGFDFTIPRSYLRGEFDSKETFLMRLRAARWQYAKRQMRWFARSRAIEWRDG